MVTIYLFCWHVKFPALLLGFQLPQLSREFVLTPGLITVNDEVKVPLEIYISHFMWFWREKYIIIHTNWNVLSLKIKFNPYSSFKLTPCLLMFRNDWKQYGKARRTANVLRLPRVTAPYAGLLLYNSQVTHLPLSALRPIYVTWLLLMGHYNFFSKHNSNLSHKWICCLLCVE